MAKLKLASAAFFIFCFLSLSYALASSSILETTDVVARDIPCDNLIILPCDSDSERTTLPKPESESVLINKNLILVDFTEANKEETDNTSFQYRHHYPNQVRRPGHKEMPYGNNMILSSHENFKNSGFKEDEGFGEGDGGLRKFHHHHLYHQYHHFDDGEVEGVEKEREGHPHPHGRWFHQRKFGGEEEHPFHHGFHHCHHYEEKCREGRLLFKLRKFFNRF